MKKIYYNKLIRDRIPQAIEESNGSYETKELSNNNFKKELLKKVGEEASALPALKNKAEIMKELADVIDVIEEIKKEFNITEKEIKIARQKAFNKKGGFSKKLFLYWSEDTGYRTNEKRYQK